MRFLLWPFKLIFELITGIVKVTGRLAAALIGLVLIIAGLILTITFIGAIIGIPLVIFGLLLMIRGFF